MIYDVYDRYHYEFIRYAKSLVTRKEDAYDIVQDAYVKAIEHEEIFEMMNDHEIKGWFFRVIKNKFIDYLRKNKRLIFRDDEGVTTEHTTIETDIFFHDMVDSLPEYLKTPVVLKYVNGLNSKEIGNLQGIPPSTIRNRLSLALNKLRDGGVMNG